MSTELPEEKRMKLIIFDLDQTLVDFISVHDEVTGKLFKNIFNVDVRLTEIDFTGKNLTDNFSELARLKNIPEDDFQKKKRQLLENYEDVFGKSLPRDMTKHILPGARELLNELSRTDHVLTLYTGSSPAVVREVFLVTDFGKYFRFCFYGTEVETRCDMVRMAVQKAETKTGQLFEGKNIVVIGDSVRDVECGKLFHALTISVATGFHSREQLSAAGADFLFDDLKDYKKVITAIEGL